MIRKADIILGIILIIAGLAVTFFFTSGKDTGSTVHISVDGEEYAYYSLLEDRTITVEQNDHINKITINNGSVSMSFSNCPNHDCIRQGAITDTSQTIVCLPNKVVVEIHGEESQFDAIAQ